MSDPRQCVILVPAHGPIDPQCEAGLRQLEHHGYVVRREWGHTAIDYGRNAMASVALEDGYQELVWIDSDIGFTLADVEKLRDRQLSFVAGVYPKKNGAEMAAYFHHSEKEPVKVHFGAEGGLVPLDYVGFGFVYTRADVYHAIRVQSGLVECNGRFGKPITPYFLPMVVSDAAGPWYLPEDYAFCWRARHSKIDLLADTTIILAHCGRYAYTVLDVQRHLAATNKLPGA